MDIKNWILLYALGAIWGSAFMFIKVSAVDFGPIVLVTLRLLLAGLLFIPFLIQKKYLIHFKSHLPGILILAIFNNALPFTMFSYASLGATSNMLGKAFQTTFSSFLCYGSRSIIRSSALSAVQGNCQGLLSL